MFVNFAATNNKNLVAIIGRHVIFHETLEVFERRAGQDFALAWVDGLASGCALGRGVIWFARWADRPDPVPPGQIARALDKMGYRGVIGMEAWPQGDDDLAIKRFRAAFTL